MSAGYRFLPWVRDGLAAGGTAPDPVTGDLPARGSVALRVHFAQSQVPAAGVDVRLYGPGDVTGIDPAQVIRVEPAPGTAGYPPNYFAFVEFDRPDLPWMVTPASAGDRDRLRPWLFLAVVDADHPGVKLDVDPARGLPVLTAPASELPDPAEAWAWAHAQVAVGDNESAQSVLDKHPDRTLSRIVCPRRLRAGRRYLACVVPLFDTGRVAGLGGDPATAGPGYAWGGTGAPRPIPVYHHWSFSTGEAGDFEHLAARLAPRPLPPEAGMRPMYVGAAGEGLPALDPDAPGAILGMEGALRAPDALPTPWPEEARDDFHARMEALLAGGAHRLAPPVYGAVQAETDGLPAEGAKPHWLRQLNLDPRHRAAAALGTRVIQQQQEALVASAWRQAAEIRRANQVIQQGDMARAAQGTAFDKRVASASSSAAASSARTSFAARAAADEGRTALGSGKLLQVAAPVVAPETGPLRARPAAAAATTGAFRRIARPFGPVARRLGTGGAPLADPVDELAVGGLPPVDPLAAPAGMVAFDDLPGPDAALAEITPERVKTAFPWWTGARKTTASLAAADAAALTPDLPTQAGTGTSEKTAWDSWFVVGMDGRLWEMSWVAGRWIWHDHGHPAEKALARYEPVVYGSERRIFAVSIHGELLERWHDGDRWHWSVRGMPFGRAIHLGICPVPLRGGVFVVANETIAEWRPDSGGWVDHLMPEGARIRTRPNGVVGDSFAVRGSNGNFYVRRWTGSAWTWFRIPNPRMIVRITGTGAPADETKASTPVAVAATPYQSYLVSPGESDEISASAADSDATDGLSPSTAPAEADGVSGEPSAQKMEPIEPMAPPPGGGGDPPPEPDDYEMYDTTVSHVGPGLVGGDRLYVVGHDGYLWDLRLRNGLWYWRRFPPLHWSLPPLSEVWAAVPAAQSPDGVDTVYASDDYRTFALRRSGAGTEGWTWTEVRNAATVHHGGGHVAGRGPVIVTGSRLQLLEGGQWLDVPQPVDSRGAGALGDAPPERADQWALPLGFLSNLLVAHVDNPERENTLNVRLGRKMDFGGNVTGGWTEPVRILGGTESDSIGWETQGLGVAVYPVAGVDGQRDLVVLYVDNPGGVNTLFYRVGFNVSPQGQPASWSPRRKVPLPVADHVLGADIALADLDGDGRPEIVVAYASRTYTTPLRSDRVYYRVGWRLSTDGEVTAGWTDSIDLNWSPGPVEGVGVAVADMDGKHRPDLVVMTVQQMSDGASSKIFYRIYHDLNARGRVTGNPSPPVIAVPRSLPARHHGAGIAVADFTGTSHPDLVVFTLEDRAQANWGTWWIGHDLDEHGVSARWTAREVPLWFGWDNAGAAIAVADVDPQLRADREAMGQRFQRASARVQGLVIDGQSRIEPEKPDVDSGALADEARAALEPGAAIEARVRSRVTLGGRAHPAELRPLVAAPSFPQPMYLALKEMGQELLFPGVASIPPESVSLLRGNPAFIEAFMAGLNHEMARELLWREFPADRRATYFQQFWDVRGAAASALGPLTDVPPIAKWDPDDGLGAASTAVGAADMLMLVVRGELLRRFPRTLVYARKAEWIDPAVPSKGRRPGAATMAPQFRGALDPDLVFFGLPLTPSRAAGENGDAGWYFVFQQPPTEPRFGLDEADGFGAQALPTWYDLHWGHLADSAQEVETLGHLRVGTPSRDWMRARRPLRAGASTDAAKQAEWGFNAAHMAQITYQPPAQVLFHATRLLSSEEDQWRVAAVRLENVTSGRVVELGGPRLWGGGWRMPVGRVIELIGRGERFYVLSSTGARVPVVVAYTVAGRAYVRTVSDATTSNNLSSLPRLPEAP